MKYGPGEKGARYAPKNDSRAQAPTDKVDWVAVFFGLLVKTIDAIFWALVVLFVAWLVFATPTVGDAYSLLGF